MFKLYRYFFYQFYKLAQRTEKQWSPILQMPEYTANFSLSIFITLLSFTITSFFILSGVKANLALIPPFMGLTSFVFNYFFIIKTSRHKLDEQEYDHTKTAKKRRRRIIFIFFVSTTLVSLILISLKGIKSHDMLIYSRSKEINVGMPLNNFLDIMQSETNKYEFDANYLIYYYDVKVDTICGIEIYIDKQKNCVKRIDYKNCNP